MDPTTTIDPALLKAIRQAVSDDGITWQTLAAMVAPTLLAWFGSLWWAMRRTCDHISALAGSVGSTAQQLVTQVQAGQMTIRVVVEPPDAVPAAAAAERHAAVPALAVDGVHGASAQRVA